jgi:hypothetical protein
MSCDVKRIQQNSAQAMVDQANQAFKQAKTEYIACLGPREQAQTYMADVTPERNAINKEVEALVYMENFILKQLKREISGGETVSTLLESARKEADSLRANIDTLNATIRKDRRTFLDAGPSVSTAVNGLYFTQEPDNQVLIAFLSCFGAFLLFSGVLILMNRLPIPYIQDQLTSGNRVQLVIGGWILSLILAYTGLYMFT